MEFKMIKKQNNMFIFIILSLSLTLLFSCYINHSNDETESSKNQRGVIYYTLTINSENGTVIKNPNLITKINRTKEERLKNAFKRA